MTSKKVLKPNRRDTPRDRDCTWNVLRNAFCGSCGCVDDPNEGCLPNECASSSSDEWTKRVVVHSQAQIKRGLEQLNTPTIPPLNENNKKKRRCKRIFKNCCRNVESVSSNELINSEPMRKILINKKQISKFPSNYTKTAKYNFYNFLPIYLYQQFQKNANIFFLCTALLQQIPGVSPTGRYITLFPLIFILMVSSLKEIHEDRKRHIIDKRNNSSPVICLKFKKWEEIKWRDIEVGDIVKIYDKESFPADLVLLSSSNNDGMCFVKTVNLDGESNLKMRQALPETANLTNTDILSNFKGVIECQIPNRKIYDFFGVLRKPNETPLAFGPNQFLQRGAALSNTEWIIGIAVYTGQETKLMKSLARAPFKCSSVDRLLNKQFWSLFGIYLFTALMSASMNIFWVYKNYSTHTYLDLKSAMDAKEVLFNCISFMILYNTMIPISLQVTVECVHFVQAIFINSDLEMYHAETDTCAMARSSNLNEELGMVEYVLTDKTGTLTCNVMKFKMCSIAGILYELEEGKENMDKSQLVKNLLEGHPTASIIEDFMLLITLCHSVVSETKNDGSIIYHATNPDDQAIIEGAADCGYTFLARGSDYIDIKRLGNQERYELLQVIEFSSNRKRMSVLIRMPDGTIKLFCKGADSIIFSRLSSPDEQNFYDETKNHLEDLARQGYRTLCCAVANITEKKFNEWIGLYRTALTAFTNREELMEAVADQIEQNLTLLGVTAIEDKLQDGVPETISFILAAGIRIWMLTGDKRATAINIAFASGLLNNSLRVINIEEADLRNTYISLITLLNNESRFNHCALVIEGSTLEFALNHKIIGIFKEVCIKCRVVIFCRLSPVQKGKITDLVNTTGACTLAIGDGANDVAMIRKANVGIGISGFEGYQAAAASDFSIAQFRYLKRLLFVHGTWNFHRITTLALYCFYKNIILSNIMMWYCLYNGWSAQVLFDRWVIAGYNILHTASPPAAIGIFDKVCNARTLLKYPRIYSRAQKSKLFNVGIFWVWILNAHLHSVLLFFVPLSYFFFNQVVWPEGRAIDLETQGNFVYTVFVTVVCLKAGIILHSWNYITHLTIWGSLVLWVLHIVIYSYFWPVIPAGENFVYAYYMLFPTPAYWLYVIVATVITLLPDLFLKVFLNRYFLPLNDISLQERSSSHKRTKSNTEV